jgi:protein lifeguard
LNAVHRICMQTLRIFLPLQTFCLSVSVGAACSVYAPEIVLEAVVITAAIVSGLAAYSFHATRKGKDFT